MRDAMTYLMTVSEPDANLETRTLNRVVVATDGMAADGAIVVPEGIELADYMANPVVLARHGGFGLDVSVAVVEPPVIARCLSLALQAGQLVASVQFADTDLGRKYGYLYGVNEKKEAYMRAWSIRGRILESRSLSIAEARSRLGTRFDESVVTARGLKRVMLITRFRMQEFSAVEIGADREALTRAAADGNDLAVDILDHMQVADAMEAIRSTTYEMTLTHTARQITRQLTEQYQALTRDGSAAAGESNSANCKEHTPASTEA